MVAKVVIVLWTVFCGYGLITGLANVVSDIEPGQEIGDWTGVGVFLGMGRVIVRSCGSGGRQIQA